MGQTSAAHRPGQARRGGDDWRPSIWRRFARRTPAGAAQRRPAGRGTHQDRRRSSTPWCWRTRGLELDAPLPGQSADPAVPRSGAELASAWRASSGTPARARRASTSPCRATW